MDESEEVKRRGRLSVRSCGEKVGEALWGGRDEDEKGKEDRGDTVRERGQ
jgi:hypothetical protein